ncbi:alkaline phosphatase D family protein [Streptomyces acidicola]|uniref:alkaline phosphatase D family protein n=1 Tax=Streptomyces acidicola TaxID=2596892 RepID=UPI00341624B1
MDAPGTEAADTQAERDDPSSTMLGAQQERWLADGLGASTRTWKVLAQQTVMARADRDPGLSLSDDNWSGYEPARQRTRPYWPLASGNSPTALHAHPH